MLIGARQTGKTTLASDWARRNQAAYLTMDDATVLSAATEDPQGFIMRQQLPVVIDEIQKKPALLPAVKLRIDRNRHAGMFLLTGSANVLTLPKVAESLAGRMEIHTLWPFSQGELNAHHENFITNIFSDAPLSADKDGGKNTLEMISKGGYPDAIKRNSTRAAAWYASYISSILQRDMRDLAQIDGITAIPKLLAILAANSACILNTSSLTSDTGIPNTSLKRYLALLEAIFIIYRIPAWSVNIGKRVTKSPKIMMCDTGLGCYLTDADSRRLQNDGLLRGRLLENFTANELSKQLSWSDMPARLYHFRAATGEEIDFILEDRRGNVVAIEVKSSETIGSGDFKTMRMLAAKLGTRFVRGVLLHTGKHVLPYGEKLWSAPLSCLWS